MRRLYTDNDIDTVFEPELAGLSRQEIRDWYNGYNWLGEGVYKSLNESLLSVMLKNPSEHVIQSGQLLKTVYSLSALVSQILLHKS